MTELKKPSEFVFRILGISGMMVPPGAKFPKIFSIYVLVQCVNTFLFILTNFVSLTSKNIGLYEKLECFQYGISTCHILSKHMNIVLQRKRTIKFFTLIDDMWSEFAHDPKYTHLFVKAHKISVRMVIAMILFYDGLIPMNFVLWLIKNFLMSPDVKTVPLALWVFFDWKKHIFLGTFYQLTIFGSALLSIAISIALVRIIAEQGSVQMQILHMMLESRSPEDDKESNKKIYKLHQKIIIFVKEFNSFFSAHYCFEMVLSSMQIAARGYAAVSGLKEGNIMILASYLLIALTVIPPFVICYSGNLIKTQGEKIYRTAYRNQWYYEKTDSRKDLLIMMTTATYPVHLHYRYFVTFSMEQFTTLMQATYSYLTMIQHFDI
ncbi:odorant receptor 46a-like [Cimex lectularius]|uniref:Odorant receptor n=1 Tax=Cimex lectularius TaxID=79782 RepID=A0A8I6SDZ7_CIMLE|nr:odorant receptor 46a-like [Cimex lectularius]XP_024081824.1 odorant receptor 46a-like [Cimex lectularius]